MNPLVSIIIPIYNVEKYVRHCIQSILSQDINHSLVELIIVNDCTLDNSMEIVKEIIGKYKTEDNGIMSIKILSHAKNRGVSASRNTGMKEASGEFVFFVDSDDYLFPDAIKNHLKYHKYYPEADIIIGNYYDEHNAKNNYNISCPVIVYDMNSLFVGKLTHRTVWNNMVRRKLLTDSKIEFVEGIYFEDDIFNYQLIPLLKTAMVIPEVTYFYRKNPHGIMLWTRQKKVDKTVNDYLCIMNIFLGSLSGKTYVGKSIRVFSICLILYDYINNHSNQISDLKSVKSQFSDVRRKMLLSYLRNVRLFLFLLSLFVFPPINKLIRYRWFRQKCGKMINISGYLEVGRDKFLNHFKSCKY